mgnify:CR=1 FL=1
MGWWEGFKNAGTQAYNTVTSNEGGQAIGNALLGAGTSAIMDEIGLGTSANIPSVGYQGGIPSYEVVRDRVDTDPNRRRGGENQRYFTDTQYAEKPGGFKETTPPSIAEAQARAATQRAQLQQRNLPPQAMAMGGIAGMNQGYYLGGATDGMADLVPASIDGTQEARLSDGEFVIPADVVSHLGNGNSDAGAKQLHGMMDTVRKARTGNSEQGKQINPTKFMPKMAQGGIAAAYNYGGSVQKFSNGSDDPIGGSTVATPPADSDSGAGQLVGKESSLSNYVGPYVTDMLGKGAALAETPYQEFQGPLTAGISDLQQQSFTGIGNLQTPTNMGVNRFDATAAQQYMNPYLMASINPQIDQARRQAEIQRIADAGRLTKAGAFGGSRQAVMEAEGNRALGDRIADITGQGYASAYDRGLAQFNTEQDKRNQFGFDVLGGQATAGATQRSIEQQGIGADIAQFEEERDFPYKQVQYMQSLLQGLPLEAQSVSYSEPSDFAQLMSNVGGLEALGSVFGFDGSNTPSFSDIITASGGEDTAINDAASQILTDSENYGNIA